VNGKVTETIGYSPVWRIEKFEDDDAVQANNPYSVSDFEGNLLVTEGLTLLTTLITGGSGTAWTNAAARLGVGDSTTAAAVGQTALQASSNKTFKAQEATFPTTAAGVITWKSSFGSSDANFAWNEFCVVNAATDSGTLLNRLVSAQGTKVTGQTWTLQLQVTFS